MLTRRAFIGMSASVGVCMVMESLSACTHSSQDMVQDALVSSTLDQSEHENINQASIFAPKTICVVEYANNTLALIDSLQGVIVDRIALSENPAALVASDDKLYISCSGSGELNVIPFDDTAALKQIPVGLQPLDLCYDNAKERIIVADYHSGTLLFVDTHLDSVVESIVLPDAGYQNRKDPPPCCRKSSGVGRRIVSLALSHDAETLYCANYGTYDIARVDMNSLEALDDFDGVIGPRELIVSNDDSLLLLAGVGGDVSERESNLFVYDRNEGSCLGQLPVGSGVSAVCQSTADNSILCLSKDEGALVVFDSSTWSESHRCLLSPGVDSIVLNQDSSTAYITNSENGTLSFVNLSTLEVSHVIQGLVNPREALVIP